MIQWPPQTVSDLARRRTVIFLGSGISKHSLSDEGRTPKTWSEFLTSAITELNPSTHIRRLVSKGDYLTACDLIKSSLGRDVFHAKLRDEYAAPRYRSAPIHELIFRLDSRIVATPNFDKIYETYANHTAGGSIIVKCHFDPDIAEVVRGTDRVILKVHGTIDSPERMIFTRTEYAEARQKHREFYSLLEALAITHTFIFLGCGINDPDIKLLLEDLFYRHPSARRHIFVLPKRSVHDSVLSAMEASMNLTIITYKPAKKHQELTDSLRRLVALVDEARQGLAENRNW